jgi:hypothetical protein
MKQTFLLLASVSTILVACGPQGTANRQQTNIEGAWQMVSGTYTTPDTSIVLYSPQMKILTATHFAFGRMNPDGAFAGGGEYRLDGNRYTEIVRYHSDPAANDTTLIFDAAFDGDSLWYHEGTIGPNFHLKEVWRRVK